MKSLNKVLLTFCLMFALALGLSHNGVTGLPPTAVKGLFDSVFTTAFNFLAPNKLATKTSKGFLFESGNKNILANPSFESSGAVDSWTYSPTPLLETSDVQDGKASLKFTPFSQVLEVSQDSTINAAGYAGGTTQGIAMVRVKVSTATDVDIQVCPRKAGVILSAPYCVSVPRDNAWHLIKIPFILGATSNGISVHSLSYAGVTGTITIDDMFVGPSDLKVDIDQSRLVGAVSFGQTVTRTNTAIGAFTGSTTPVTLISPSMGTWSTTATTGLKQNITNLPAGCYRHEWQLTVSGSTAAASESLCASVNGVCDNTGYTGYVQPSTLHHAMTITGLKCFDSLQTSVDFELYGAASAGSIANNASWPSNFRLTYYNKGGVYTSNNADTDWAPCAYSSLAWQGLGTVSTPNLNCKRQGSDLLMRGNITSGTVTASAAQIMLPTWNGVQLAISSLSSGASMRAGVMNRANGVVSTIKEFDLFYNPSNTYLGISTMEYSLTSNPFIGMAGNAIVNSAEPFVVDARIPIAGWDNSNIIIGQFNGLESCSDTFQCTDSFSAKISSADVVSEENLDWITGDCTDATTGRGTCTFKTGVFSVTPNCQVTAIGSGPVVYIVSQSSSSITYEVRTTNDVTTAINGNVNISCQKQGADYIGKTAKAVASDQNVRSIGSVGVDIQSVYFGSGTNCTTACTSGTCTICRQIGTKITSVTWEATGVYRFNGIDGSKYMCSGVGLSAASSTVLANDLGNSTTSYARMLSRVGGTLTDTSYSKADCVGVP